MSTRHVTSYLPTGHEAGMNTAAGRAQSDQYNEDIRLCTLEVAIAPALKPSLSGLPGARAML